MLAWWDGLVSLNQGFYVLAVFFSTVFVWQFISSLSAIGAETEAGDGDVEAGGDGPDVQAGDGADDLLEDSSGLATFRLLSVRSILAFGTLFSWAGALYLQQDIGTAGALIRALLWGLSGMVVVGLFFWVLPRLSEEATSDLDTASGRSGPVYMNIPADGVGQVKVIVSGRLRFVRARSRNGRPLQAGTMVRIVRKLDAMTLEVEEVIQSEEV